MPTSYVDDHGVRHQLTLHAVAGLLRVNEHLTPAVVADGKRPVLWGRTVTKLPDTPEGRQLLFSLYPSLAPGYAAAA